MFVDIMPRNADVLQFLPPIAALYAMPTPHTVLFALAATSPPHLVP